MHTPWTLNGKGDLLLTLASGNEQSNSSGHITTHPYLRKLILKTSRKVVYDIVTQIDMHVYSYTYV